MTTNYCPNCPIDNTGSRRSLLLDNGTRCHGCDYKLPVQAENDPVKRLVEFVYSKRGDSRAARTEILEAFGKFNKINITQSGWVHASNDLPRNIHLEFRTVRGFKFIMFPISYPGLKRFHVVCPECSQVCSVGHYMMHAAVHSK